MFVLFLAWKRVVMNDAYSSQTHPFISASSGPSLARIERLAKRDHVQFDNIEFDIFQLRISDLIT